MKGSTRADKTYFRSTLQYVEKTSTGEEEIPDIDEYLVQPEKPMDSRLMQQVHASQGFFTAADLPDSDSDSD